MRTTDSNHWFRLGRLKVNFGKAECVGWVCVNTGCPSQRSEDTHFLMFPTTLHICFIHERFSSIYQLGNFRICYRNIQQVLLLKIPQLSPHVTFLSNTRSTESHRCQKFIVAQESAHPLTTRGLNSGLGLPLGFSNHTKTLASASAPALAMYGLLGWKATSNMLSSNFFLWAVISWTHCLLSSCHRRMLQSWPGEKKKKIKIKWFIRHLIY